MTSTTVSITRFWRSCDAWLLAGRVLLVLLGLAALLATSPAARSEGISVRSAQVESGDEGYTLSANFDITFSPILEEALNRGVALNFLVEFELIHPRWYWFNAAVVTAVREWKLSYNALTREYRLSSGTLYQNFELLEDARRVMSAVRGLPVGTPGQFARGITLEAAVRMRLDVSRLPKPFQVSAITGRDWSLASDWYRFTFTP